MHFMNIIYVFLYICIMCICLILPLDICMPANNTLCVSFYVALDVNYMLNKNSLAVN